MPGPRDAAARGERDRCSDDGRDGAQRDERLHDGCPVEAQAEKWTHAGRVRMTRKLGRVARGVKREYCTASHSMRVMIEYCVVCNYEPRAAALAAEIRKAYPQAEARLIQGAGGVFDVEVDGKQAVFQAGAGAAC